MNEITYQIQRYTTETQHWEPLPEGDFDSPAQAEDAIDDLVKTLAWERSQLRIAEVTYT